MLTCKAVKEIRRQKLEKLFQDDENKFEKELQLLGYAFRRDRT